MKQSEVVQLFQHCNPEFKLRVDWIETDDAVFYLGQYSCILVEGKWTLGKEWTSYSSEYGQDGGTESVEEDPGHSNLANALAAMARLFLEDELSAFLEHVGEIERTEFESVQQVMDG